MRSLGARSLLFYIGLFGYTLAVGCGIIPEETQVFDTELLMSEVIQFTHYMPDEWKGQLHSKIVSMRKYIHLKLSLINTY